MGLIEEFNQYRSRMNAKILASDNLVLKRFFNLDTNCYQAGTLSEEVKEMIGLACSMVLRCDDCIKYHLGKCHEVGISTTQVFEVFAIANLIGGSIVIPHLRRAVEYWEELQK
jgi:AhpD family alkylhydroperoxidase